MSLKTDYKDAIPTSGAGTLRKYKQVDNGDGTISFQDVTTYSQAGDMAQASVFNGIGAKVNEKAIQTYTHAKSGTVHALTGSGPNGKFLATSDYAWNDTFTVNGTAYPAASQDGNQLTNNFFVNGSWVYFHFDGSKLGFRSGGGGSYGTLPAQVSNLYATVGNASAGLAWTNPSDSNFAGVKILRKAGGYPLRSTDGTKIYDGTGTSCTDTGIANGVQYYYRAFAYNEDHECQTSWCVTTVTPIGGYQLGTFPVGTPLYFGKIFGNPIKLKIANKSGSDITLISDEIITIGAFDVAEPNNSNSDRQQHGNNRYLVSNVHQWLNSEASNWYSPQHSADAGASDYLFTLPGLLNGFSAKEKNYLKSKSITVAKATIDGGGVEIGNARMWLPSCAEVGIESPHSLTEGSQLALFTDTNSRIANYTVDAANKYHAGIVEATDYLLRTPYSFPSYDPYELCGVTDLGREDFIPAAVTVGIRPCCVLDSTVMLDISPDANGVYSLA